MNRTKSSLAAALSLVIMGLAGCSADPVAVVPTTPAAAPSTAPANSTAPTAQPAEETPGGQGTVNDLQQSPVKRTFKSGGLTFNVEYSAAAPVNTWTPNGPKVVRVSLTALNNRQAGQKVYVTRAGVRFNVRGVNEDLPGPDPIIDTANIDPGYLVTFPYSYEQSFSLPPLDEAATAVQLDFKFEVVSLVDKKAKDYTKQTANNTVRIVLDF